MGHVTGRLVKKLMPFIRLAEMLLMATGLVVNWAISATTIIAVHGTTVVSDVCTQSMNCLLIGL